jgi:UbiD family decarboxylase
MAKDLRSYLEWLATKHPEEFMEVKEAIDPAHHEVAAYLKLLEDKGQFPVTVFRQVKNLKGEPSQFPLVHNPFATRSLCAMAIGLEPSNYRMGLVKRLVEIQDRQIDYVVIEPGQAPVLENIWRGEEADMTLLPAARYHEKDAGPYFVMGCAMKGKSGNFYNVTMTKHMVKGARRMSISASAHHDLARIIAEHETRDEPTPVAVILGHHPAFYLGSCPITPYGNDDYRSIGGYLGEPLRLVPSASLGDEFLIPADAEIVIEGLVLPGVRESQNPFGEISGHYQPPQMYPVIETQAICFRRNAVMEGILPAHPEHIYLGSIPKEGSVYSAIRRVVPDVKAVCLPKSGYGRFSSYISLKKKTFRDAQVAGMVAFAEMPNLKMASYGRRGYRRL